MSKKTKILSLIILIILGIGIYFSLETRQGKIFKYKFSEWKDDLIFELKNNSSGEVVEEVETEINSINEKQEQKPVITSETTIVKPSVSNDSKVDPNVQNSEEIEIIEEETNIDSIKEFQLDMAFASQAPHGNWDFPYQEACEEASIIMTAKYLKGEPLTVDIMDAEILDLVDWEMEYFGYYEHTTAQEIVETIETHYDLNAEILENPTISEMKELLYAGKPIIVPAAGRALGNPYFSGEGPVYHVLVLIGWKGDRWITNDPGTRHGEGFTYPMNDFMSAIHDSPVGGYEEVTWELILTGEKRVIAVDKD